VWLYIFLIVCFLLLFGVGTYVVYRRSNRD